MSELEQKLLEIVNNQHLQIMALINKMSMQNDRLLEELLAQRVPMRSA